MKKVIMKSIIGTQGSWEAQVSYDDGSKEMLPCLHKYYTKGIWPKYYDPWATDQGYAIRESAKFTKHIALIQENRRVILTDDEVDESKNRAEGFFQRKPKPHGYLGVYAIKDFVLDETGMHLVFTDRMPEA